MLLSGGRVKASPGEVEQLQDESRCTGRNFALFLFFFAVHWMVKMC